MLYRAYIHTHNVCEAIFDLPKMYIKYIMGKAVYDVHVQNGRIQNNKIIFLNDFLFD